MNILRKPTSLLLPAALIAAALCGCQQNGGGSGGGGSGAAGKNPSGIVSAEKTSFDEVTSKLDKGGDCFLYLSTEKSLSTLADRVTNFNQVFAKIPTMTDPQRQKIENATAFISGWLRDSGIDHISGIGMSSIAREPSFYHGAVIVHHYPGQNQGLIWSMFGKQPHPLAELDLLPDTTAMAMFSDVDAPLIWSDVQKHAALLKDTKVADALASFPAQFQKATKLDWDALLSSLGGNVGIVLTLDPAKTVSIPAKGGPLEIPSPALAIVAKVHSDLIFDRLDALMKANPQVVKTDTPELKMRTMPVPIPVPVDLRPTIARSGDYLILATSEEIVKAMLEVKAGKAKGFKSTPEYARLSQNIPTEGNSFAFVSDNFVKQEIRLMEEYSGRQGGISAQELEAMRQAHDHATNHGAYSVGLVGADGWEAYVNSSQTVQSLAVSTVVGGAVGAAVSVALPYYLNKKGLMHGHTEPSSYYDYQPAPAHGPAAAARMGAEFAAGPPP